MNARFQRFYLFGHSNLLGLSESFLSAEFKLLNINIKVEVDSLIKHSFNDLATVGLLILIVFKLTASSILASKNGV